MRVTDFTSMFHESGFVFVAERASENRNGNREPSTRTKAAIRAGVKNPDPRDHVSRRGYSSRYDEYTVKGRNNSAKENSNRGRNKLLDKEDDAYRKADKARKTNIPGSSNITKHMDAYNKYRDTAHRADNKAFEKYAKHKAKHESAELGFEII